MNEIAQFSPDSLIATCRIVEGELAFGVAKSERVIENLREQERFLNTISILELSSEIANAYGIVKAALFEKYAPKQKNLREKFDVTKDLGISDNDIWIAAFAWQHQLKVVTSDKSHFQWIREATGTPFENWGIQV